MTYAGDKEERARLQQDLRQEPRFHVLLTTYEVSICFSTAKTQPGALEVVESALEFCFMLFESVRFPGKEVSFHEVLRMGQ